MFDLANGPHMASSPDCGPGHTIEIKLELPAEPLVLSARVPAGPMGLADVVPLARKICDLAVSRCVWRQKALGRGPSCRKGCSACCHYMVPVSIPEAIRLRQDVAAMPSRRRKWVEAGFTANAARIVQSPPPDLNHTEHAGDDIGLRAMARWYSGLGIVCPLLVDHCCALYDSRPIGCREHLVTSRPELCASRDPAAGTAMEMPLNVSQALSVLAAEMEGTDVEALIMPTALAWAADNEDRTRRTWPGELLVERLAAILADSCRQTAAPGAQAV